MSKFLLLLSVLFSAMLSHAQLITTIAGTGVVGYSGDGGQATAATFNNNNFVTVDSAGEVYVADQYNHRIRKIDMNGIITTIAGNGTAGFSGDGGPASAAECSWPVAMVRTPNGNTYSVQPYVIRRIDPMGIISTIAGNGTTGYTGDGGPATNAAMQPCWGIAANDAGDVYFSDQTNHVVRKIDAAGIITTVAGTGIVGYSGDGGPATAAQLRGAMGLTLDTAANLFIVDAGNNRIRRVDAISGIITTIAGDGTIGDGGDGGPATAANFTNPLYIAFDEIGNLYLTDVGTETVRRIDTGGIITKVAGNGGFGFSGDGGPATAATFKNPYGLTVLGNGVIFITDMANIRVRVVDHPPTFIEGHTYSLTTCYDTPMVALDTLLSIVDSNTVQLLRWSLALPPAHGVVLAADTLRGNAGMLIPSGLSYTPSGTYIGNDTFSIRITDGIFHDTLTFHVTLTDCHVSTTHHLAPQQQFHLYPNPSLSGTFTCQLNTTSTTPMHITVTDATGRLVKETESTTNKPTQLSIDAGPGIYMVQVRTTQGSYTKQITVVK